MEVTLQATESLSEHPQNPKRHTASQIEHIANSIQEFEFTQPIVVDENLTILIGHGRWAAAKKLEQPMVPIKIMSGLSEEQKVALLVIDNAVAAETGFDAEAMAAAIEKLTSEGFDLAALGLGTTQIGMSERGEGRTSDAVKEAKEAFDNAETKALTFFFLGADLEDFNKRLEAAGERLGVGSKAETIIGLLDWYENRAMGNVEAEGA